MLHEQSTNVYLTKCVIDLILQFCLSIAMKLIIIAVAPGIISTFGWQWMNRIAITISSVAISRIVVKIYSYFLVSTLKILISSFSETHVRIKACYEKRCFDLNTQINTLFQICLPISDLCKNRCKGLFFLMLLSIMIKKQLLLMLMTRLQNPYPS